MSELHEEVSNWEEKPSGENSVERQWENEKTGEWLVVEKKKGPFYPLGDSNYITYSCTLSEKKVDEKQTLGKSEIEKQAVVIAYEYAKAHNNVPGID